MEENTNTVVDNNIPDASVLWDKKVSTKFHRLYQSATKRNMEFGLRLKDVSRLLRVKRCFYSGKMPTADDPLSFERLDNDKGYIPENVVMCLTSLNKLKSNLTLDQISMFYKAVKRTSKPRRIKSSAKPSKYLTCRVHKPLDRDA